MEKINTTKTGINKLGTSVGSSDLVNDELINKDGNMSVVKKGILNVQKPQYLDILAHTVCLCVSVYCVCMYVYVHAVWVCTMYACLDVLVCA